MRTLLIILLIFLAIRIAVRYILPIFINNKFREMQDDMRNQQYRQTTNKREENDITLEYNRRPQKESKLKDKGEYVDFEEVE